MQSAQRWDMVFGWNRKWPLTTVYPPWPRVIYVQFWYLTSFVILSFVQMPAVGRRYSDFPCRWSMLDLTTERKVHTEIFIEVSCAAQLARGNVSNRPFIQREVPCLLFHRTVPPLHLYYSTWCCVWQLTFCKKNITLFCQIGRSCAHASSFSLQDDLCVI